MILQEIVEKELDSTFQEIETLKVEISHLAKEGEKLQILYTKRDELLGIFCLFSF